MTLISSLYSTIEFLKGEINVKNELINKLLNRCNHCERNTKSLNDDLNNSIYDDASYCNATANNDHLNVQNTIDHKVVLDDRYATSQTKSRISRLQDIHCHNTEIIEYDDTAANNKLKSVAIIGDSILNNKSSWNFQRGKH